MRADLYIRQPNAELLLNPKRTAPGLPAVSLDARFQKVDGFEARIPSPPSIYNLVALNVQGDVVFGKDVVLEGTVDIIIPDGAKLVIPDGARLKDVKITAQADLK
jgi:UTP--glucose-1-phosphate uridylyltransferase